MLLFQNDEEINLRGITTFGTSVKKDSSSIGFFGTGLKYAIAVVLRLGGKITIFKGEQQIDFETASINFRGEDLNVICMTTNDSTIELAFTTSLGKTWKAWQAYRELFCNMLDEEGTVELLSDEHTPNGVEGKTRIYVWGLDEEHSKRFDFILNSQPLYDLSQVEVHPLKEGATNGAVFYRGIRIYEPTKKMLFNYNLKLKPDLTEDRTLKYSFMFDQQLMYSVIHGTNHAAIEAILTAEDKTYEADLNFMDLEGDSPSEEFLSVMRMCSRIKKERSSFNFYSGYAMSNLDNLPLLPISTEQEEILLHVKEILKKIGFQNQFPIVVTDMVHGKELSRVGKNTIYLNIVAFNEPIEKLAAVIYNDYMELKYTTEARMKLVERLVVFAFEAANWTKFETEGDFSMEELEEEPNNLYKLEGIWDRTGTPKHIEFLSEAQYQELKHLECIEYTDGTKLSLFIFENEANVPKHRDTEKLGYTELIRKAARLNKRYVKVSELN